MTYAATIWSVSTFLSYSLWFSRWSTAGRIITLPSLKRISDEGYEDLCSLSSLCKDRLEYMSYL